MNNIDKIKLFITDIDGVWTDGGMYYDNYSNEFKKFNTSDSVGILFLKLLNIKSAIISGENTNIVKRRAIKLNIEDYKLGVVNKVIAAEKIIAKYNINWNQVAFIGDDINDIALFSKVGLSACPSSSSLYIKNQVDWVLEKKGGDGVFREFVEKYLSEQDILSKVISLYLENQNNFKQ